MEGEEYDCDAVIAFLKDMAPLLNAHLVHFYKDGSWMLIPERWREQLEMCCDSDVFLRLLEDPPSCWPSSLIEFAENCKRMSLGRSMEQKQWHPLDIPSALKQMKGMSVKKRHEVSLMAGMISSICEDLNIDNVVDIGAGSAYLSHTLYLTKNIRSIGIEGNPLHTQGALERFQQLTKKIKAYNNNHTEQIPTPIIDLVTCRLDYQKDALHEEFENCMEEVNLNKSTLLIGLHCCGDLSPAMLRLFCESPIIKGLVVVSCCYNKMTIHTGYNHSLRCGFPMSEAFKRSCEKNEFSISQLMLEVSVSCYRRWMNRSNSEIEINRKSLAYRAILEEILSPHIPPHCAIVLRGQSLPIASYESFKRYLIDVAPKVFLRDNQLSRIIPLPFELSDYTNELQEKYNNMANTQQIDIFQAIKMSLQPVLESMFLMDRKLYLIEQGYHAQIIPLFNESLSPRNMAIMAIK